VDDVLLCCIIFLKYDECRICDQWWIQYTEIHNDGPPTVLSTQLTLHEKCFIKFCMKVGNSDIPP